MPRVAADANAQNAIRIFKESRHNGGVLLENLELLIELGGPAHGAAVNMAVDEVLLLHARHPILRVYGWACPAVTYGYFERWEPVAAGFPGREWIRRWTGGGVVPHGEDWTYSLIVPRTDRFAVVNAAESYRLIHEVLGEAMRAEGVQAGVTPEAAPKISQACFENAAQYDVLAGGHKIAGAAQRRSRFGMLHQGSVQGLAVPAGFAERLAHALAATVMPRRLAAEELAEAQRLAEQKYATDAWNHKF